MEGATREATVLLARISSGDEGAPEALFTLLYDELRQVAGMCLARERPDHTLHPTDLVHEIWLRTLAEGGARTFVDRQHYVRAAARAMRHVLVDHARARLTKKRGAGERGAPLDAVLESFVEDRLDVVELHDALESLAALDPELGRLVELRYFAGLSIEETARVMEVSTTTVERSWRVARMWLRKALPEPGDPGDRGRQRESSEPGAP
jgi:RNA polymerase sigma factor (TIGR02999 family)